MNRPTTEKQLEWQNKVNKMNSKQRLKAVSQGFRSDIPPWKHEIVSKALTDDDLVEFFTQPGSITFWMFRHCEFLWRVVTWNWFCIWCAKKHFWFTEKKCVEKYDRLHPKEE